MKELFLPEAANDTAFFVIADTSPKALLQLGMLVAVIAAVIVAVVVYCRKRK